MEAQDPAVDEASPDTSEQPAGPPSSGPDPKPEDSVDDPINHEDLDSKPDISDKEVTEIMEVIAGTGKFWHDWDLLKGLLSYRLRQVLEEYPESQEGTGSISQQSSLSGETYAELVKRLDEALQSFIDGPPFTLQRLCEILLAPKSLYPKLSKLALALEKNLLVTSTLSICTDPYPGRITQGLTEPNEGSGQILKQLSPTQNGVSNARGDTDEEMADAEADEIEYDTNNDVEMQEGKIEETPESVSELPESNPSPETNPLAEPSSSAEHSDSTETNSSSSDVPN